MCEQGVCCVVQKIAGLVGAQIWHEFGYFLNYDSNIENLRIQVRTLDGMRAGVEGSVNAATRSGEVIGQDVVRWQANVSEIISEANTFLADVAVRRSFYDWSRYSVSKEAKTKTEIVTRLQIEGRFTTISYPPPPPNVESFLAGDFFAFPSRTSAFDKVIEALKDDDVKTIGIWGMGGVGKTTLVKQIGEHVKVNKHFDEVLMAVVSQRPNIKEIQDQLGDMLGLKFAEETKRAVRLKNKLNELLKDKKILVILDDIWSELELADDIGIPSSGNNKNLKIVLTTRREQVCTVMGCKEKIALAVLSESDSWNLFRVNVGDVVDSATLNVVAREVASECCGLPIALVTVGRALRNNGNLQQWNQATFGLRNASPTYIEGVDKKVYTSLKLSYAFLPSEESKETFLLCCLFPEDHDIEIETLVHYAVGKRLFQGLIANTMDEAREKACEVINNVKDSCLLLKSNRKDHIKVHDIVRDVGISIAFANNKYPRASVGLERWPTWETLEHCTPISLMYNDIRELPQGLNCPSLKILLLQGNENLREIPDEFFEGMVSLEVLDLSYTAIWAFPASITVLTNLRTLRAKGTNLYDISILGELKNLEILDLEYKPLGLESTEIGHLSNLRVLNLNGCFPLSDSVCNFISSLSQLDELYLWTDEALLEVEDIEALHKVENIEWNFLSSLNILHIMMEDVKVLPEELCARLKKFYIAIPGSDINEFNKRTETTLCLSAKNRFVGAIKVLLERTEDLQFVGRQWWRNVILDLDELGGGLQRLQFLRVDGCDGVEYVIRASAREVIDYFPNLLTLHINDLKDLKEICHGLLPQTKCFGELSKLGVCGCGNLRTVVPFNLMTKLLKLEKLEVHNCHRVEVVFDSNHEGVSFPQEDVRLLSTLTVLRLEYMDELQKIWKDPTRLVCLRNLKRILVYRCKKLREIFSPTISQTLLQLEYVSINSCGELEEVVTRQEEEITVVDVIIFPKLKSIRLWDLRNLKCFCSGRISFQFPALERLTVRRCYEMKTFTSGSVSTPNLKFLELNGEDYSRAPWLEDLNHTIQNSYNTKQEREEIEESEDDDSM